MDTVEFVEKICGCKLWECQKELLRECEKRKAIYIIPPAFNGRTYLKHLSYMAKCLFDKGEEQ